MSLQITKAVLKKEANCRPLNVPLPRRGLFSMTAHDLAKEWLRYARSDLNTAVHMFKD
jgi:hypothetical protein